MLIDILSTFKSLYIVHLEGEIQNGLCFEPWIAMFNIKEWKNYPIQIFIYKVSLSSFSTYS
jgi:hypothetical protein